jgi:hypothetical protein
MGFWLVSLQAYGLPPPSPRNPCTRRECGKVSLGRWERLKVMSRLPDFFHHVDFARFD